MWECIVYFFSSIFYNIYVKGHIEFYSKFLGLFLYIYLKSISL